MATTTSRKPRAIVANPSPKASGKATKSKPERGRDLPEFVLKYAGKPDAINASTFLESLSAVATILHEANRELGTGDPVDVKIKAPKPGSFVVHLIIDPSIADHVASLFKIGGSVIGGLVGALKIWQHLKGKPPKAVKTEGDGTVSIQNESGATIIESKQIAQFVLNNSTVTFNLARTFSALDSDPNVVAFEMLDRDEKKKLADVPRAEFPALSVSPAPADQQKREITVRAPLNIVKPSFDEKLKWELVYNGNRISALVSDTALNLSIDREGEPFRKGDVLDASLRIKQEYNATLKAFLNKSYEVFKVHAHIVAPTKRDQKTLFGAS